VVEVRTARPLVVEPVQPGAPELAALWVDLQRRGGVGSPFLTWEWFSAFAESPTLAAGSTVLVARDPSGVAVGLFPLQEAVGPRRLRTLRCASTVPLAADHLDVVAEPEDRPAVASAVAHHVARRMRWDVLDLDGLDGDGSLSASLARALRGGGCIVRRPHVERICVIDSRSADTERVRSLLVRRSARGLKSVRRAGGGFAVLERPDEVGPALQALMTMHNERFGERSSVFATPELREFHVRAATRLAASGMARVCRLYTDEQDTAFEYVLALDDRAFAYQSGFRADGGHAPGRTVMCQAILAWLDEGRGEYDLLRGDEPYKLEYATGYRHDVRLRAMRPSFRVAVWAAGSLRRRLRRSSGGPSADE
jgi:CelD/BcsL family acetyltransferase involved in cellulose biosynthesis